MIGAAIATLVAYVALFVGMWLNAQRVYPVPYQWRRVADRRRRRGRLTVVGKRAGRRRSRVAVVLAPSTRSCCSPLGFYLPAERRRLRRRSSSRRRRGPRDDVVAEHEQVHLRLRERLDRLLAASSRSARSR